MRTTLGITLISLLVSAWIAPAHAQFVVASSVTSTQPSDNFGYAIAFVDDCDGDGIADYIVGAPKVDSFPQSFGYARIVSGATGATWIDLGVSLQTYLVGNSVAGAGDVDGDGRSDVLVHTGVHGVPGSGNHATVYSGATGQILRVYADTVLGTHGLGSSRNSMQAVGDLDLDGVVDSVIGAPATNSTSPVLIGCGAVVALSGASGLSLGTILGNSAGGSFGFTVCATGDLDHDGVPDFAVGAPHAGPGFGGTMTWIDGATCTPTQTILGSAGSGLGFNAANAGDIDHDGVADLVAPTPNFGGSPILRFYSGATGAVLQSWSSPIPGWFMEVAFAGDQDGDGTDDLLVGDSGASIPAPYSGALYLLGGGSSTVLRTFPGAEPLEQFGWHVAAGSDTNGDGRADLIASSWPDETKTGVVRHFESSCQTLYAYGSGCAGTGGFVPELAISGCVTAPSGSLTLSVTNAHGGKLALLFVGLAPAWIGLSPQLPNCALLVAPTFAPAFTLPLAGAGPGGGSASATFTLSPAQLPLDAFLQAICTDPNGLGYATSNGFVLGKPGT